MGLGLAAHDIQTLDVRTGGWIAALQLAALSMQGREDVGEFIAGFAGDDWFVVDYLVGEVLERQSDAIERFLLRTSVLDRLQGSLWDAVTGTPDGKTTLEALDTARGAGAPGDAPRPARRDVARLGTGHPRGDHRPAPGACDGVGRRDDRDR
jgi:LuxR family maltose regulon positive regulatory protein